MRRASRVAAVAGLLALMAYHGYRFGDPLAYIHAHDAAFRHELAEESGVTLVGFLRGTSMNVYTGAERITAASPAP